MNLLPLEFLQGDDLKAPTTCTNLALPPSFTAEVSHTITEERGFDVVKTLNDVKFRARREDQPELRDGR